MKKIIIKSILFLGVILSSTSCFNLEEEVYDRVDSKNFYTSESSVKAAIASVYEKSVLTTLEPFMFLQELSADQVAWRCWNGGMWGYDDAQKYVLSVHSWTAESDILEQAWEKVWTTIGLCNNIIYDLQNLDPKSLGMTASSISKYISELRTIRAVAYYNIFELWGGALPLNTKVSLEVPPSADPDFDKGCKKIYDFIMTELDESLAELPKNSVNRMNQAVNRIVKARLYLNAEIFIKENHYKECAAVCQEIMDGKYGNYKIVDDYRDIYAHNNNECPEVIFAYAYEDGHMTGSWVRNMPFLPYNIYDYFGEPISKDGGWNCMCLAPSYDNSGEVLPTGGTIGAKCFLDAPYGDKLGATYERMSDKDIRKSNYKCDEAGNFSGMFLKGEMRAAQGTGEPLKADADRDKQPLVYVDQVGTFLNIGRPLETVMSSRWGETNSGIRLVKYPQYPKETGFNTKSIDEVEFRLAEVVYMLAECKMREGDADGAKKLVNSVRKRYFKAEDWGAEENNPGRGFTEFDMDWMLSQWGLEYLCEGHRRRTDLRRFDKFTQGQWWFFGRATETAYQLPAKRDRKYEWYPLPNTALNVNPNLTQNPNY